MPPSLVHEKFPSQNDKLITFYHPSETPCSLMWDGMAGTFQHQHLATYEAQNLIGMA